MSQPNKFNHVNDFANDALNNIAGRSTLNAQALDDELNAASESINKIVDNLKLIQRDDGRLADVVVEVHTLSREVLMLLGHYRLRGLWVANENYVPGDVITNDGLLYVCSVAHADGLFILEHWLQFGFAGSSDVALAAAQAQNAAQSAGQYATTAQAAASTSTQKSNEALSYATSASSSAVTATAAANTASSASSQAANANSSAQSAAATAQAAASTSGVTNERIVYGDDASKTTTIASAELANSSGFYESTDDVPASGKWLITTVKSKTNNDKIQTAYKADDLAKQYTRRVNNGVKSDWSVQWNSTNFNPDNKANLAGANFTGFVSHNTGSASVIDGNGKYGKALLVQAGQAGGGGDGPQIWFHKPAQKYWSIGIKNGTTEGDCFVFMADGHGGSWGSQALMLNTAGQLFSASYGWLHEKFLSVSDGTTNFFTGGGISVSNEGAPQDPYGGISVTKPAVGDTPAYFSMTRSGRLAWLTGIGGDDNYRIGTGTGGFNGRITNSMFMLNTSGQVWASNYGWLHDRFISRNVGDVGSVCFAKLNVVGSVAFGGGVAGGSLVVAGVASNGDVVSAGALSGTWVCLGIVNAKNYASLFMRVA